MSDLTSLERERRDYAALAKRCEARARRALERGDRATWYRLQAAADQAWQMNAWVVGEIDRREGGAA